MPFRKVPGRKPDEKEPPYSRWGHLFGRLSAWHLVDNMGLGRDKLGMPEKYATSEATASYFENRDLNPTKLRQFAGKTLSALAVGTYLGASDNATDRLYEEALVHAAQNGVNFFDTAINYRCQRSERNIAYALRRLAGLGIHRDQMFISTKGGFLPADGDPESYQEYIFKCFLNTGIMTPDDIVENCHCMTPKYLETLIDLSLNNLKVSTIDLYYLHNPEIQLKAVSQQQFYENLKKAFEVFEAHVAAGKIKKYGLATWDGFRLPFGQQMLLDLDKIVECAREVGGDNHNLAAIQLPYNFAMLEAVAIQNQKVKEEDFPLIPAAVHHDLSVFVSAPLMQSHTLKINPKFFETTPGEGTPAQKSLDFVVSSPGVVSAMVGMKTLDHVKENLKVLESEKWEVSDLQHVVTHLVKS